MISKSGVILTFASVLLLAGCSDTDKAGAQDSASADTAPAQFIETSDSSEQRAPLVVDETKVLPVDDDVLATADWTAKNCSLDSVDGVATDISISKPGAHVFRGFLIGEANEAPGAFSILLKGAKSFEIPVSTGALRPDVAEFFKNPSLLTAGYEFSTTLNAVSPGTYAVWMLIRHDGRTYFCEAGKTITVK